MLHDPIARFTNSSKGSSGKGFKAGIHLAKVSRVTDDDVFVVIPTVNAGQSTGPCQVFTSDVIAAGDIVVVAFLDSRLEEVVVLGKKVS